MTCLFIKTIDMRLIILEQSKNDIYLVFKEIRNVCHPKTLHSGFPPFNIP